MKLPIAFLVGLSVFPAIAVILWYIARHDTSWSVLPVHLDAETLARARAAQEMVNAGRAAGAGYSYEFFGN
jgi:hypothetical protein